ncbi:MAG TPA: hypothetical protein VII26_02965 [Candidatus Limnocylindria bacterium]
MCSPSDSCRRCAPQRGGPRTPADQGPRRPLTDAESDGQASFQKAPGAAGGRRFCGNGGAAAINNLMEDAATAEISRLRSSASDSVGPMRPRCSTTWSWPTGSPSS